MPCKLQSCVYTFEEFCIAAANASTMSTSEILFAQHGTIQLPCISPPVLRELQFSENPGQFIYCHPVPFQMILVVFFQKT